MIPLCRSSQCHRSFATRDIAADGSRCKIEHQRERGAQHGHDQNRLLEAGRADFIAEADYRKSSKLSRRVALLLDAIIADVAYRREAFEVRLENRVGNPVMDLNSGSVLSSPECRKETWLESMPPSIACSQLDS